MVRLSDTEIMARLAQLPGWRYEGVTLTKTYTLADFPHAVGFVVQIGMLAEAAWHHPDLTINWNKVGVTLSTHEEGGVTEKDCDLAAKFEESAGVR